MMWRELVLSRRAKSITLALAVLGAILGLAGGATAADNTLSIDPATSDIADGATFNVRVVENATVAVSGVSATITFNKGILQVTSVTRGSAFASAPLFLAGDAAAIASANKSGKLQNVAVAFFPPTSVPAGKQEFLTVGFKAIACGTVDMTVPTGRVDATMLDGRTATYGVNLKLTTTGATVTVCGGVAGASPGASDNPVPSESGSLDPTASASVEPSASGSPDPAGGATASAPPPAGSVGGSTGDQSGWLNFALAALAVAAAALAALIIVMTLVAIVAAVVGAIVLIRVWRRYAEKDAQAERDAKEAPAVSAAPVDTPPSPSPITDGPPADHQVPADGPKGSAIPFPTVQT